jgi:quercetin dioxygenase-like cupin family protein
MKLAKIDGPFIWHAHPNSDELFYLLSGKLTLEIEGQDPVIMNPGDVYVVPKDVRHRPVAENAYIMMVEQAGTINTGDETSSDRTRNVVESRNEVVLVDDFDNQ